MTTKVTFVCHGPGSIKVTPINDKTGEYFPFATMGESVLIAPGRFNEQLYAHAGVAFKVEEVLP